MADTINPTDMDTFYRQARSGMHAATAVLEACCNSSSHQAITAPPHPTQAKYPLIKYTDMTAEMREEAMDIAITAVEKHALDMEKCTQASKPPLGAPKHPACVQRPTCVCATDTINPRANR
jgi:hypothetical protein